MRIVVLTSGGRTAPQILRTLHRRGVVPEAVVVATYSRLSDCFHHPGGPQRVREIPLVPLRAIWRRLRPRFRSDLRLGRRLVVTSTLNSDQMRRDLARLAPDLLVLAGCRLITPAVIQTAAMGVVNVHPGLLPWLRNNGVVGNAIARGLPVGVTVHRVDPGIDTGPVIRRKLIAVSGTERTLETLETAADQAAADLLAQVVFDAQTTGVLPPGERQTSRFPLCHWLSAEKRRVVDQAVAAGRAAELFAEWLPKVAPGSLELPPTLGLETDASVDKLSGPA